MTEQQQAPMIPVDPGNTMLNPRNFVMQWSVTTDRQNAVLTIRQDNTTMTLFLQSEIIDGLIQGATEAKAQLSGIMLVNGAMDLSALTKNLKPGR